MSSGTQTNSSSASHVQAPFPRTVEAVSWFDRARIRNRRLQMPAFRSEVQTPTQVNDLASLAEQASKNLYKPTMDARGLHMKTIQEDFAEAAHDSGLGLGPGRHGYEVPAKSLNEFDGFKTPSLGSMPLLGRLFGLIQRNPRAATKMVTNHQIAAGVFSAEVTSTVTTPARYIGNQFDKFGRPMYKKQTDPRYWMPAQSTKQTRLVDLTEPMNTLTQEELASMDEFTRNLFQSKQMTPQQILALHDRLQAGQRVNLKAGPNAAEWLDRIMGDVGQALKEDAARIGGWNLIATICQIGSVVASALGFAAAVGMWGYGMAQMQTPDREATLPTLAQQSANPFAAPDPNADPYAAFGQAGSAATPQPQAPNQPFGAVSQNFGNLPSTGNYGPTPPSIQPPQTQPADPNDGYGWTRVNSAAGRVLMAQAAQMPAQDQGGATQIGQAAQEPQQMAQAIQAALQGAPSPEQIEAALDNALSMGDTPQGQQEVLRLLEMFGQRFSPQIDRFDMKMKPLAVQQRQQATA